jgi:serine/threonine protein kinase
MEYASTDWEKEIMLRKEKKNYYSEGELLNILKTLIKTFSNLQKINVSHGDIKPQNILKVENDYKICDFGEASDLEKDEDLYNLKGTELYMSPILFNSLKRNQGTCKHNLFKSDVFSLGMCMILASTLSFNSLYDIRECNDMKKIKNIISSYIISKYSFDYINILLKMIEIDENKRQDFIQLENSIRD